MCVWVWLGFQSRSLFRRLHWRREPCRVQVLEAFLSPSIPPHGTQRCASILPDGSIASPSLPRRGAETGSPSHLATLRTADSIGIWMVNADSFLLLELGIGPVSRLGDLSPMVQETPETTSNATSWGRGTTCSMYEFVSGVFCWGRMAYLTAQFHIASTTWTCHGWPPSRSCSIPILRASR